MMQKIIHRTSQIKRGLEAGIMLEIVAVKQR